MTRWSTGVWLWPSLAVTLAALHGAPADAAALRCGSRIVSRGDSAHQVASVCGEPIDVVQRVEIRTVRSADAACVARADGQPCVAVAREVVIEQWTYDFGANKLVKRLTFEDGVLTRIDSVR